MFFRNLKRAFLRFAFYLFYNRFAFTYDPISAVVSRGHWRDWTRAAIPHIIGRRVLEIPCGTGNLLLDLHNSGYAPIGVDLSNAMLGISQRKFQRAKIIAPLIRARAQMLPFAPASFNTIVMTFPPEFIFDPTVLAEFHRILDGNGRLIWVDAARLLPRDAWSRALNAALDATSGEGNFASVAREVLSHSAFEAIIETVRDEASLVTVVMAKKFFDNPVPRRYNHSQ